MTLRDYTTGVCMLPRLDCDAKDKVIARLVQALAEDGAVLDADALMADILAREAVGDTSMGRGLAIPHARSPHVRMPRMAIATLAEPIAYHRDRDRDVNVVILLVGPDHEPRLLLRLLARIARIIRLTPFLTAISQAQSPEQMLAATEI